MERETTRTKKTVVIFVLCALALQGIFCLFFTTRALEATFPLYVRAASQEVVVGDNSYTEYFRLRNEAVDSDVIVIGMDFSSPQTFALLSDMLISLKHDANIGAVIIDAYGDAPSSAYAAEAVSSIMPGVAEFLCDRMRETYDVSDAYETFLDYIGVINEDYPPTRKMYGVAICDEADHVSALLHTIHDAWEESRRPVLLLTDADRLREGDPFRIGADASGERYLFVRCCYTNGVWDGVFPSDTSAVYMVERDDLHFFDSLYTVASTFSDGEKGEHSYSELFSTEIFFVITDGSDEGESGEEVDRDHHRR